MLVLGTDPGLAALGFGSIHWEPNEVVPVQVGTIRTDSKLPLQERIRKHVGVLSSVDSEVIGIENQERAWAGMQVLGRTSADAVKVRVVEGVIRTLAVFRAVPLIEVTPAQIRSALGLPAGATKQQVRAMVMRRIKGLPLMSEHATDAVAIALATGARWSVLSRLQQRRLR
ncbi:MAG: crossover junction endodeoxyribonuclease RuvC [Myxococcota bacterium]